MRAWPSLAVCAGACLMLAGCGTPSSTGSVRKVDTRTAILGPDGSVVYVESQGSSLPLPVGGASSPEPAWTWTGDAVEGAPRIVISIGEQAARFYKGDTEVGWTPISTGRDGFETPTGSFRITQKNENHVSNLYGAFVDSNGEIVENRVSSRDKRPPGTRFRGAPMPYFMRVHGAVGLHAGYLPGYADSHGCIRLPTGAAKKFFAHAPSGTPVLIEP